MDKPTKKEVAKEAANVIIDHCESIKVLPKGAPNVGYRVGSPHPSPSLTADDFPPQEKFNE